MRKFFISFILGYFRLFARLALKRHKPIVIGITGSVGKSSERNAVSALLKDYFSIKVIEKGNSETGIPLGILGLTVTNYSLFDWLRLMVQAPLSINYLKNTKYLVIEMGVDEPLPPKNMGYLLTIVKPQIAIFLNAFPAHTLQFSPSEAQIISEGLDTDEDRQEWIVRRIATEKGRIITESGCEVGIYNRDNKYIQEIVSKFEIRNSKLKKPVLLPFGKDEKNNIHYGNYEVSENGSMFTFYINWDEKKESILLKINDYLLPQEYQEILGAAILVGKYVGLSNLQITQALQKNYSLPKSRSTLFHGIKNSLIIDSSYNASRAAVLAFLRMAYDLKKKLHRPLVFIFGDMRELGGESKVEHEIVAREIVKDVDYLYCVGELTKKFILPLVETRHASSLHENKWFTTSTECGKYIGANMPENAIILVKGSQNTIFLEESIKPLLSNSDDAKNLCRQEEFWMKRKNIQ